MKTNMVDFLATDLTESEFELVGFMANCLLIVVDFLVFVVSPDDSCGFCGPNWNRKKNVEKMTPSSLVRCATAN